MSDISEELWCAGWYTGNEYWLWELLMNPTKPRKYGLDEVSDQQLADLRAIADEIGGWIVWDDKRGGPLFMPMDEWLAMYESGPRRL